MLKFECQMYILDRSEIQEGIMLRLNYNMVKLWLVKDKDTN